MNDQLAAVVTCTNIDRPDVELWSEDDDRPHRISAVSTEASEQNQVAVASQHAPDERGQRGELR